MEMQINKIIRWNLGLIISIGVYGIITDEPYWKEVGHLPNLYDYLFWFATALNGPSILRLTTFTGIREHSFTMTGG